MAQVNFHGVTTIELLTGPRPVELVRTGVIGLVGIAPKGPRQTLVQVLNDADAAQFGSELPGFNIPEALNILLAYYKAAPILVVNVFNPDTHLTTVSNESKTVGTGGKFKLAYPAISDLVITTSGGSPTTLTKDTDYTVDDFGNVQILTRTTYTDGTSLVAGYKRLDPTTVNSSAIVGAFDSNTGVRTGCKLFVEAYNLFGYKPKVLIAPRYSTLSAVANELQSMAIAYRGEAYIDAPLGTTVAGALAGRGPAGTINWNRSNDSVGLPYPMLKRIDPYVGDTTTTKLVPYSIHLAGCRNKTDRDLGFWFSTSNQELQGVDGIERNITWELNNPNCEATVLNESGIITVAVGRGTGYRVWGNHSSAFPTQTHPVSFLAVRRTANTVYDSLEMAMLNYIDKPITPAIIDEIRATAQSFIDTLIQKGALVIGSKCTYDAAKNTAVQIAQGQLTFTLTLMPPPPLQRLVFEAVLDVNLLGNLSRV